MERGTRGDDRRALDPERVKKSDGKGQVELDRDVQAVKQGTKKKEERDEKALWQKRGKTRKAVPDVLFSPDQLRSWRLFQNPRPPQRQTSCSCSLVLSLLVAPPTMSGSFYAAPNQQRHLRACMVCSIVQTHTVSSFLVPSRPTSRLTRLRNSPATAVRIARIFCNSVGTMMRSKNVPRRSSRA